MSIALAQAALERHLFTLPSIGAVATENNAFTPVTGVPYMRLHHLINTPKDITIERDLMQERGIFQVSLFYPLNAGRVPAMQRAEAIRALFKPVLFLTNGAVQVEVEDTPRIGSGEPDGDRWHLPVSIYWHSFIAD